MKNKEYVYYIIIGIIILGILILTFFPQVVYIVRDAGDNSLDKCKAPNGYTQEKWEEHKKKTETEAGDIAERLRELGI